MDAAKKFWTLPELGERLVSFLDPLSVLHLAQSKVMEKKTLQNSLTSKAWSKLIRRTSLQVVSRRHEVDMEKREDLKVLVKILNFVELGELSPLLRPLLDLICESSPGQSSSSSVQIICPCRPEPHSISTEGFLLLEQAEAAFGTTEQSLKSIGLFLVDGYFRLFDAVSSSLSRMSRQKETVAFISAFMVFIEDKSDVEALVTLMQAEMVSVGHLNLRSAKLGEENWQELAGAFRAKDKAQLGVRSVVISRKFLTGVRESIKDIWDATWPTRFEVFDNTDTFSQRVEESKYNGEEAWTRLEQIADMTEDEFAADCKLL